MAQNFEIRWSEWAWEDLRDLAEYITGRDGAAAARRQSKKILDGIDSLSTLPRRCRIVPELREIGVEAYRELIIAPYRVFFRIDKQTVRILGALDGRRDLEEILIQRAFQATLPDDT